MNLINFISRQIFGLLVFVPIIFISCEQTLSEKRDNNLFIPDTFFKFVDLSNFDKKSFYWDYPRLYLDSTNSDKFHEVSNWYKHKLLSQTIQIDTSENGMPVNAYYIAKFKKLGRVQPILIRVYGTDYDATFLVNLSDSNSVLHAEIIDGGENSGPEESSDSLIILRPIIYYSINKDQINHSKIRVQFRPDGHSEKQATIDSITYISSIEPTGLLRTKQLDSVRYERKYIW